MTFSTFILRYPTKEYLQGNKSIIQDLARDAKQDANFPNLAGIHKIRNYLYAYPVVSEAIELAYSEYLEKYPKKISLHLRGVKPSARFEVFKRDNYSCQICGQNAQDSVKLELDHKIAITNGGTNDINNLWVLCFTCNRGKGSKGLNK